ncbi:MAG: hypothetical protein IKM61_02775 [Eubacteriaceae bacterium]|nr:hypothetical protein [Eubacteriaceae bacterium]
MDDNITINCLRGVDCLVVKKVYDAFSKRECLENTPFEVQLPGGCLDDYVFLHTQFGKAEVHPCEGEAVLTEKDDNYARVNIIVSVPVYVVLKRKCDKRIFALPAHPICSGVVQCDNHIKIKVTGVVYAPKEFLRQGRFDVQAETYIETGCVSGCRGEVITVSLGVFLVVRVTSDVSLRIPNYGFCEFNSGCDEQCEENFCETFLDETLTPFPQFYPDDMC